MSLERPPAPDPVVLAEPLVGTGAPPAAIPAPVGPRRIGRVRLVLVAYGVAAAASAAVVVLAHGTGAADLAFLVATAGAAVLGCLGAWRQPPDLRPGFVLVASGLVLSAAADALGLVIAGAGGVVPDASLADPLWLASYVALGAGVLVLQGRSRAPRVERALELAAPATVALLLVWVVVVSPVLADHSTSPGVRVLWASYPVLDALLLAVVVQGLLRGQGRSLTGALVAVGLLAWLVADLLYALPAGSGVDVLLDLAWMGAPACIAAACWPPAVELPAPRPLDDRTLGRRMALACLVPLLVPVLVEVWGFAHDDVPNPYPLLLVTVVLVVLAVMRFDRLLRQEEASHRALVSSERYYRALSAETSDAVLVLDRLGRVRDPERNPMGPGRWWRFDEGDDPLDLVVPERRAEAEALLERALRHPGHVVAGEVQVRGPDLGERWLSARVVDLLHDPDVEGIVVNLHDVTARRAAEEELQRRALHDALTDLPNRTLLEDRLAHLLGRTSRAGTCAAVLAVGVDGLRTVNDTLGHAVGDEALRQVAQRLVACVREGDTVARMAGDELVLVVEGEGDCLQRAVGVAERVLGALAVPVEVGRHVVPITVAVGIDLLDGQATVDSLLRNAHLAMHRAKARGPGRWVRYEPAMRVAAVERLRVEAELGSALESGQLRLVHQPVISIATGRLVGFEALLRWRHPGLGEVGPDRFVPVAEDTGLIVPIGRWVLQAACAESRRWSDARPDGARVPVAVNVSGVQLADGRLVDDVVHALRHAELDARSLVVEVTETALVQEPEQAREQLDGLRRLGVRIAIDDFGTGWSSLSYLRELPVDVLKVDRSFVATIEHDRETPPLLRGLLDLARTLGLQVVAEGVETAEQHRRLADELCERAQGYLYARPLEGDQALALVEEGDVVVGEARSVPRATSS